jgi:hypothetical protein
VKALATVITLLALAASASAQSNDVTFKQAQGEDGLYHLDIGVSYGFPGLPPRTANSGVGTVRVMLPGASFTLQSVSTGYTCVNEAPDTLLCYGEGQPDGYGTVFPSAMSLQLLSPSCWSPAGGPGGSAQVWAAPYDPGTAPDVTLPIDAAGCSPDAAGQPVQDTKESCKVPNVKGMKLVAAVRELVAGDCKRGKVTYAYSPKVRRGRVMKQSARPGKTLAAGSKVNLLVSKGKQR